MKSLLKEQGRRPQLWGLPSRHRSLKNQRHPAADAGGDRQRPRWWRLLLPLPPWRRRDRLQKRQLAVGVEGQGLK
jgi:hypothetical protein